jgi:hypothetical protein
MHPEAIDKKFPSLRPIRCVLAVVGLLFFLSPAYAQRPMEKVVKPGMERIDQEEGARRLAAFRDQRLQGDYVFEFQLEHKPRRARTVRYDGVMWGSWNEQGAITRFKILPRDEDTNASATTLELIIQNGTSPGAWIRRDHSEEFQQVKGEALFEPLLPDLVYSVFDLQMPFIYWDEFIYEGPSLVGASRVAQNFVMIPPEKSPSSRQGIEGVRVSLDDTYNALWRVEIIGEDESVRSKFSVESFKKVQEQYIVKRITLIDYPSKDRTTFNVVDASVGLQLDRELFDVPDISGSAKASIPSSCEVK